jgi:hypothetical protein
VTGLTGALVTVTAITATVRERVAVVVVVAEVVDTSYPGITSSSAPPPAFPAAWVFRGPFHTFSDFCTQIRYYFYDFVIAR